jgi:1-acyl-sn-glycerol-3-phosphate acyltransferase
MSLGRRLSGLIHGLALVSVLYGFLVAVSVVLLPIARRPRWAARVVREASARMVPLALWAGRIHVLSSGGERASELARSRGYIVIANHTSNLDPLALMKTLGRTDLAFLAKAETLRRPLLGRVLRAAGWFAVERDSPLALKRFEEEVAARRRAGWVPNLVVFPEGTRSADGRLRPFHVGPFLLSVRSRIPILPIVIRGAHPLHPRDAFAVHPGTVSVDVLPAIEPPAGGLAASQMLGAVEELRRRAEALYRAVPDLERTGGAPS